MICLEYNFYDDSYRLIQNVDGCFYDGLYIEDDGMSFCLEECSLIVSDSRSEIRINGDPAEFLDVNRLETLYLPLVDEYKETEDIEILVYIVRSLIPLLDRRIIKQSHIDDFELPPKSATKSARN
jgi:hypothetical protein